MKAAFGKRIFLEQGMKIPHSVQALNRYFEHLPMVSVLHQLPYISIDDMTVTYTHKLDPSFSKAAKDSLSFSIFCLMP